MRNNTRRMRRVEDTAISVTPHGSVGDKPSVRFALEENSQRDIGRDKSQPKCVKLLRLRV